MSKPIDKLEFWKNRIDTAVKPHYSVYVVHEMKWKYINDTHEKIMKEYIPTGARVLDAGCAYGRWAKLFPNYAGVDFSPDFIQKAKAQNPDKDFRVANLKQLPFTDHEFDWAIVVSIKKMVQDNLGDQEWKQMEKEITRVAKKTLVLEYETPDEYEVL